MSDERDFGNGDAQSRDQVQKIFIGRVHPEARAEDVRDAFEKFERVRGVTMKKGFAFVELEDPSLSEQVVEETKGKMSVLGQDCDVELQDSSRRRGPVRDIGRPPSAKFSVSVVGIPPNASWQDLKDFAKQFGAPQFTVVSKVGNGETIGRVEYATEEEAEEAISRMDGQEMDGLKIRVERTFHSGRGAGFPRAPRQSYDRAPSRGRDRVELQERERYYDRLPPPEYEEDRGRRPLPPRRELSPTPRDRDYDRFDDRRGARPMRREPATGPPRGRDDSYGRPPLARDERYFERERERERDYRSPPAHAAGGRYGPPGRREDRRAEHTEYRREHRDDRARDLPLRSDRGEWTRGPPARDYREPTGRDIRERDVRDSRESRLPAPREYRELRDVPPPQRMPRESRQTGPPPRNYDYRYREREEYATDPGQRRGDKGFDIPPRRDDTYGGPRRGYGKDYDRRGPRR